jgi:hypothetical protein
MENIFENIKLHKTMNLFRHVSSLYSCLISIPCTLGTHRSNRSCTTGAHSAAAAMCKAVRPVFLTAKVKDAPWSKSAATASSCPHTQAQVRAVWPREVSWSSLYLCDGCSNFCTKGKSPHVHATTCKAGKNEVGRLQSITLT